MSAERIDHQAIGRSRVATQYTASPRFLAYLRALLDAAVEQEAVLWRVAEQADIDLAEGVNLDVIGDLLGIGRVLPSSLAVKFFGFDGQPGADVFGEDGLPGIGSRFRDELEPSTATSVLGDVEYRLLIRAKIAKNHAHGTGEDILRGLTYLFAAPLSAVQDLAGMAFAIGIGRMLTFQERTIVQTLDILPRPASVRIAWQAMFDSSNYFGFDGQSGALPFGEEGQVGIGGLFAEEF